MKNNVVELMKKATEVKPKSGARGGRSTYGMSIVNNHNGKRISLTNAFYEKIGSPKPT